MIRAFISANRRASRALARRFPSVLGEDDHYRCFRAELDEAVAALGPGARVLEVGGIDRPLLGRGRGYGYDGLDVDRNGLCDSLYDRFFEQSVERPLPAGGYSLVVSITVMEHVPDNSRAFRSIYEGLAAGGETLHYFPCGNHPYSLATRLLGNRIQRFLIALLNPSAVGVGGYRAFYDLCSRRQMARLLPGIGFEDVRIRCFWGANSYFEFFVPAFVLISLFNAAAHRLGLTGLASGMIVRARRPGAPPTPSIPPGGR